MRIKVTHVNLSEGVFLDGMNLGHSLPSSSKTIKLEMYLDAEVHPMLLFLKINGKDQFLPLSSIKAGSLVFESPQSK